MHPQPPLLPTDALGRARVRALACTVACHIHPLNNLRVLDTLHANDAARSGWALHWMALGLGALEQHLAHGPGTGRCCHGDTPRWPTAAWCLVPQRFNARRFCLDLATYPALSRIDRHCVALPAFAAAHPAWQPDAPAPDAA